MGKTKSATALKQQRQRARARDEKNYSTSTSETNTPEIISRSRSPEHEASNDDDDNGSSEEQEDDEHEAYNRVQQRRRKDHHSPDIPTLEALLQELALLDNQPPNDLNLSQLLSTSSDTPSQLYEIRPSPPKGLGLFATANIPRGTRILTDACLFRVVGPKALISDIENAFANLTPAQKSTYLSLRCPSFPGISPLIRRWEANCFAMDHDTGIFPLASRINHSCAPNALFRWNARIQRETVHAIRDIKAGEEVETSYCGPHRDAATRREKLAHYGFECRCVPCRQDTDEGRKSERRRRRMMEVFEEIAGVRDGAGSVAADAEDKVAGGKDKLDAHLELIGLLEEERLFQKELGDQYRAAAGCYLARGEREKATEYARMGLQNDVRCLGADSPLVEDAMDYLRCLRAI